MAVFLVKTISGLVAILLLAILGLNLYVASRPAGKTMRAAGVISIPVPFHLGRPFIDYMTIHGSRLYAGYASEGLVGVVDTKTNRVISTINGLTRVHGIAIVPDRNLGFASSSGDNVVGVFDLNSDQLLQKIPAGDGADAIIYDAQARMVYVANHTGKTGMLIDPGALKVITTIPLGGEPEYPQADPETGLIYQNLEDTSELVVIDPQKQAVIKRYKLDPGEGPTGLALDAVHHRLFSATGNKKLIVLNAETGAIVSTLPIEAGCDGAGYDPVLNRVYTANSIGTMTIIEQDSPDRYRVLENARTHLVGHSLVVDPVTHRIYVAYFGSIAAYDPVK
ncbi:MAG TPA: YncE family protein [Candidatus Acidoferrales bacterium]|jgi:YVTN family beta-propeller protein|nr:YncE family protein [Candidatus Acidoferrales bacterium]